MSDPQDISAVAGVRRFRVDVSYDGTDFHGWAIQPGLRTVQGVIEQALELVLGPQTFRSIVVAGRTDAGVHARAQVFHVDVSEANRLTAARRTGESLHAGLLRKLTSALTRHPDVIIHSIQPALPGFDARFSATERSYVYRLADTHSRKEPLRRRDTLWLNKPLDVGAMDQMARRQVGFHDWAAFCKPRAGATTLRTVTTFEWRRDADGLLIGSIAADAFCHNMVRFLVGASVAVGRGRLTPDEVDVIRESRRHAHAVVVTPARGLTLTGVEYPGADGLAAQALRSRAKREEFGDIDDE